MPLEYATPVSAIGAARSSRRHARRNNRFSDTRGLRRYYRDAQCNNDRDLRSRAPRMPRLQRVGDRLAHIRRPGFATDVARARTFDQYRLDRIHDGFRRIGMRVSSAAIAATRFKTSSARSVMSARFPIGVATTYNEGRSIPACP